MKSHPRWKPVSWWERLKRRLTWATVDEACELKPLALHKRFFRLFLRTHPNQPVTN